MDTKNKNLDDENSGFDETNVYDDEQQTEIEDAEQPPQKQGGRGPVLFGLMLALLAFVLASWVYYRIEFKADDTQALDLLDTKASQQDLKQLQSRVTNLEHDMKLHTQSIEQNHQDIKQLQQNLDSLPYNTFDTSPLEQKISDLQQQISLLKNQAGAQTFEPKTEDHLSALARAQTVNALKTVQLLLNQHQIPQAVEVLKQWRNNKHLPLSVQTRLQQLITTLSNIEKPDSNALNQQLVKLKDSITNLSLTTETQENQEPAWYERFITVKKIKLEQQDLNSADLQQLKANTGQAIGQAQLALALHQPELWRDALNQAEKTLAKSSLDTDVLQQQLQQLRQQTIKFQIPNDLGLSELIQQLEGITE